MENLYIKTTLQFLYLVGFAFEIAGVYILYKYGLPEHVINIVSNPMMGMGGNTMTERKDNTLYERKRKKGFLFFMLCKKTWKTQLT